MLAKTFVEGHLNLAEDFYIPTITQKRLQDRFLLCLLVLYFLSQATLMTLFVMDVIYFTALQKEISIFIICLTATVLIFLFIMFIMTSGKPYRSEFWR